MYNVGSFNPAYVGTVENAQIAALYRAQWIDIPGAPRTIRLGVNLPFENEKTGLGFNIISEELGPLSQTYFDGAYSYQVPISDNTKLSFGINAWGSVLAIDYSKGTFQNPGETFASEENQSNFYPIIGAGAFMYSDNWYLGVSVPNFLTNGIYNDEVAVVVEEETQFNFIGGYVFDISDQTKFKPAFMINYLKGFPVNVNLSANFLFLDAFTIGASYRLDNAVSGLAGFQIAPSLFFGYSYDYNTNGLGEFNAGSHEAILKFYLGQGWSKMEEEKVKTETKI